MNKKFREWYLAVNIAPRDGQVQKRITAIEAFCNNANKTKALNLVKLYFGINVENDFKEDFIKCFVVTDEAFPDKNEDELKVLAGAAMLHLAETNNDLDALVELFSMALYKFRQPPIAEEIYSEILQQYLVDSTNLRNFVPKPLEIEKSVLEDFKKYVEENELDAKGLEKLTQILITLDKNHQSLLNRLEDNEWQTSIYREDSQILWWLMSGHCLVMNKDTKNPTKASTCLLLGQEASSLINNYPGPSSMEAVLDKMLENYKGKSEQITIVQVVSSLSENYKTLLTSTIINSPFVELLPITTAITRSKNTINSDEWYPKFKRENLESDNEHKLTPQEFSWQMYIECLAMKCYNQCK